jgi:DNA-binding transcriptional LysR family regulator
VSGALEQDYIYVDWGLSFALDHRRTFPDAPEAMTRVSYARMALDYITSIGGSAYLPRRMVSRDIELGLLHDVREAPVFVRQAYATYPIRSPRLALIEESLKLVRSD